MTGTSNAKGVASTSSLHTIQLIGWKWVNSVKLHSNGFLNCFNAHHVAVDDDPIEEIHVTPSG